MDRSRVALVSLATTLTQPLPVLYAARLPNCYCFSCNPYGSQQKLTDLLLASFSYSDLYFDLPRKVLPIYASRLLASEITPDSHTVTSRSSRPAGIARSSTKGTSITNVRTQVTFGFTTSLRQGCCGRNTEWSQKVKDF